MPSEISRRAGGLGVAVDTSINEAHHSLPSPTSLPKSTKNPSSSQHSKKRKRDKAKSEPVSDHEPEHNDISGRPVELGAAVEVEKVKADQEAEVKLEEKEASGKGSKRQKKKDKKKHKASLSRSNTTESQPPTTGARPSLTPTPHDTSLPSLPTTLQAKPIDANSMEDATFLKYMNIKADRSHTKSISPVKDVSTGMESLKEKEKIKAERKKWKEKEAELWVLHKAVEASRDEVKKEAEALQEKVKELEEAAVKEKEAGKAKDEVIQGHDRVREQLNEAVTCGVCFETLNDPHILSCGHIACRSCLASWFRTPGAYVSEVEDPIPEDYNLEYWTKVCHVCRAHITARPSRMYHLAAILGPLGIDPHIPPPQAAETEENAWKGMFPVERSEYLIHDAGDAVDRCPVCCAEVLDGDCQGCGAAFSIHDDDDIEDFDTEDMGIDGESDVDGQDPRVALLGLEGANDQGDGSDDEARVYRILRQGRREAAGQRRRSRHSSVASTMSHDASSHDGSDSDNDDGSNDNESDTESGSVRRSRRSRRAVVPRNGEDRHRRSHFAPTPEAGEAQRRENDAEPRNARQVVADRLAGRLDRQQGAREDRVNRRGGNGRGHAPALPAGVQSLANLFADGDMTDDEGEGSVGERGDYPDEAGMETDEDSYEDSFIDDESEGGEGGSDEEDQLDDSDDEGGKGEEGEDGDESDGHDSLMGEGATSRVGDDDSGDEMDMETMRRRRLRRFQQR